VLDIAADGTPWVLYARPTAGELVLAFRQSGSWFKAPIRSDDAYGFDLAIDGGEKAKVAYRRRTGSDRGIWFGTNATGPFNWIKATGSRASEPAIALLGGGTVGIAVDGASGLVWATGSAGGFTEAQITVTDRVERPDVAAVAGKARAAFSRSGPAGVHGVYFARQP
jgi:hypothetical protein